MILPKESSSFLICCCWNYIFGTKKWKALQGTPKCSENLRSLQIWAFEEILLLASWSGLAAMVESASWSPAFRNEKWWSCGDFTSQKSGSIRIHMDSSKNDEKYLKIRYEPEKKITQSINRHGDFKFHGNFHAGLCHNFSKSSTLLYPTIAGKPSDSSALSYVSPLNSHISGYNLYITIYTMYT